MKKRIIHVMSDNNINNNFLRFIKDTPELNNNINHFFIRWNFKNREIIKFYYFDKIILHGLSFSKVFIFLFLNPWLLKKTYWVMWGWDLYFYKYKKNSFKSNIYEFIRKIVIRRIGNFITYIDGDYKLAKKWYGIKGKYYKCIMYESNLYKNIKIISNNDENFNILVGNSATETNNHLEIFKKLEKYKNKQIKIIVPLTYGCKDYRKEVIKLGRKYFGNKFVPLVDFMDNDVYIENLSKIDIAIFNHKRQQAMGNTITLLGMGKKVYIRSETTQWQLFKKLNIKIFDSSNDFDDLFTGLSVKEVENNIKIIKKYFSKKNLIDQWKNIFNS